MLLCAEMPQFRQRNVLSEHLIDQGFKSCFKTVSHCFCRANKQQTGLQSVPTMTLSDSMIAHQHNHLCLQTGTNWVSRILHPLADLGPLKQTCHYGGHK